MGYYASQLPAIMKAKTSLLARPDASVEHLYFDTRKIKVGDNGVFFAIRTPFNDGHHYLESACQLGVSTWVIEASQLDSAISLSQGRFNIIALEDTLSGLQSLAAHHRRSFHIPVIGITGSNAKTIVKEWLGQMLEKKIHLVKSPKSYNSQVGVPISVWQMNESHQLGIFEAGISKCGEMNRLQQVIAPNIGIFTNIGSAHDEGFSNRKEKIAEKLKLFTEVDKLVICAEHVEIVELAEQQLGKGKLFIWSSKRSDVDIAFELMGQQMGQSQVMVSGNNGAKQVVSIPFTDVASIENVMHCIATCLLLGVDISDLQSMVQKVSQVEMRLELKQGVHGSYLIDDTYNNDIQGLRVALEFMSQQEVGLPKSVILSDFISSGWQSDESLLKVLNEFGIGKLYFVGQQLTATDKWGSLEVKRFERTEEFIAYVDNQPFIFGEELVLIKGARDFEFERIVKRLEKKSHDTVLEINLDKLVGNYKYYRSVIGPKVKLMAMVKAAAYGSGMVEVARALQYHQLDYLGVAYVDEGVELREKGVRLPVMVMNVHPDQAALCFQYGLEPALHGQTEWDILHKMAVRKKQPIAVHIALDTGMHRLGFQPKDIGDVARKAIESADRVMVKSIYSHLVGADEYELDRFSQQQIQVYSEFVNQFKELTGLDVIRHICNSAGILRFPEAHFDMVRLGVGLYGVDPTTGKQHMTQLQPIVKLKTHISQLTIVPKEETIGYGRKGKLGKDSVIATLALGYGDGYSRKLGNGNAYVMVKGKRAYTIGNICMDLMMVDVTDIPGVKEGDEAIVLGEDPSLYKMAEWLDTIPYEVLTSIGNRVKRVFYRE